MDMRKFALRLHPAIRYKDTRGNIISGSSVLPYRKVSDETVVYGYQGRWGKGKAKGRNR